MTEEEKNAYIDSFTIDDDAPDPMIATGGINGFADDAVNNGPTAKEYVWATGIITGKTEPRLRSDKSRAISIYCKQRGYDKPSDFMRFNSRYDESLVRIEGAPDTPDGQWSEDKMMEAIRDDMEMLRWYYTEAKGLDGYVSDRLGKACGVTGAAWDAMSEVEKVRAIRATGVNFKSAQDAAETGTLGDYYDFETGRYDMNRNFADMVKANAAAGFQAGFAAEYGMFPGTNVPEPIPLKTEFTEEEIEAESHRRRQAYIDKFTDRVVNEGNKLNAFIVRTQLEADPDMKQAVMDYLDSADKNIAGNFDRKGDVEKLVNWAVDRMGPDLMKPWADMSEDERKIHTERFEQFQSLLDVMARLDNREGFRNFSSNWANSMLTGTANSTLEAVYDLGGLAKATGVFAKKWTWDKIYDACSKKLTPEEEARRRYKEYAADALAAVTESKIFSEGTATGKVMDEVGGLLAFSAFMKVGRLTSLGKLGRAGVGQLAKVGGQVAKTSGKLVGKAKWVKNGEKAVLWGTKFGGGRVQIATEWVAVKGRPPGLKVVDGKEVVPSGWRKTAEGVWQQQKPVKKWVSHEWLEKKAVDRDMAKLRKTLSDKMQGAEILEEIPEENMAEVIDASNKLKADIAKLDDMLGVKHGSGFVADCKRLASDMVNEMPALLGAGEKQYEALHSANAYRLGQLMGKDADGKGEAHFDASLLEAAEKWEVVTAAGTQVAMIFVPRILKKMSLGEAGTVEGQNAAKRYLARLYKAIHDEDWSAAQEIYEGMANQLRGFAVGELEMGVLGGTMSGIGVAGEKMTARSVNEAAGSRILQDDEFGAQDIDEILEGAKSFMTSGAVLAVPRAAVGAYQGAKRIEPIKQARADRRRSAAYAAALAAKNGRSPIDFETLEGLPFEEALKQYDAKLKQNDSTAREVGKDIDRFIDASMKAIGEGDEEAYDRNREEIRAKYGEETARIFDGMRCDLTRNSEFMTKAAEAKAALTLGGEIPEGQKGWDQAAKTLATAFGSKWTKTEELPDGSISIKFESKGKKKDGAEFTPGGPFEIIFRRGDLSYKNGDGTFKPEAVIEIANNIAGSVASFGDELYDEFRDRLKAIGVDAARPLDEAGLEKLWAEHGDELGTILTDLDTRTVEIDGKTRKLINAKGFFQKRGAAKMPEGKGEWATGIAVVTTDANGSDVIHEGLHGVVQALRNIGVITPEDDAALKKLFGREDWEEGEFQQKFLNTLAGPELADEAYKELRRKYGTVGEKLAGIWNALTGAKEKLTGEERKGIGKSEVQKFIEGVVEEAHELERKNAEKAEAAAKDEETKRKVEAAEAADREKAAAEERLVEGAIQRREKEANRKAGREKARQMAQERDVMASIKERARARAQARAEWNAEKNRRREVRRAQNEQLNGLLADISKKEAEAAEARNRLEQARIEEEKRLKTKAENKARGEETAKFLAEQKKAAADMERLEREIADARKRLSALEREEDVKLDRELDEENARLLADAAAKVEGSTEKQLMAEASEVARRAVIDAEDREMEKLAEAMEASLRPMPDSSGTGEVSMLMEEAKRAGTAIVVSQRPLPNDLAMKGYRTKADIARRIMELKGSGFVYDSALDAWVNEHSQGTAYGRIVSEEAQRKLDKVALLTKDALARLAAKAALGDQRSKTAKKARRLARVMALITPEQFTETERKTMGIVVDADGRPLAVVNRRDGFVNDGDRLTLLDGYRMPKGSHIEPYTHSKAKGLYSIVGANGADRLNMVGRRDAEEFERDGWDRETILSLTGWWRGKDGKWRVELPEDMQVSPAALKTIKAAVKGLKARDIDIPTMNLVDIGGNAWLFRAYPELRDAKVAFARRGGIALDKDVLGWYDPEKRQMCLDAGLLDKPKTLRAVLCHETQHAIQAVEGFDSGSSEKGAKYDSSIGEVEARNVEKRLEMTPQERLKTPPWETEDVPEDRQTGGGKFNIIGARGLEYGFGVKVRDFELKLKKHVDRIAEDIAATQRDTRRNVSFADVDKALWSSNSPSLTWTVGKNGKLTQMKGKSGGGAYIVLPNGLKLSVHYGGLGAFRKGAKDKDGNTLVTGDAGLRFEYDGEKARCPRGFLERYKSGEEFQLGHFFAKDDALLQAYIGRAPTMSRVLVRGDNSQWKEYVAAHKGGEESLVPAEVARGQRLIGVNGDGDVVIDERLFGMHKVDLSRTLTQQITEALVRRIAAEERWFSAPYGNEYDVNVAGDRDGVLPTTDNIGRRICTKVLAELDKDFADMFRSGEDPELAVRFKRFRKETEDFLSYYAGGIEAREIAKRFGTGADPRTYSSDVMDEIRDAIVQKGHGTSENRADSTQAKVVDTRIVNLYRDVFAPALASIAYGSQHANDKAAKIQKAIDGLRSELILGETNVATRKGQAADAEAQARADALLEKYGKKGYAQDRTYEGATAADETAAKVEAKEGEAADIARVAPQLEQELASAVLRGEKNRQAAIARRLMRAGYTMDDILRICNEAKKSVKDGGQSFSVVGADVDSLAVEAAAAGIAKAMVNGRYDEAKTRKNIRDIGKKIGKPEARLDAWVDMILPDARTVAAEVRDRLGKTADDAEIAAATRRRASIARIRRDITRGFSQGFETSASGEKAAVRAVEMVRRERSKLLRESHGMTLTEINSLVGMDTVRAISTLGEKGAAFASGDALAASFIEQFTRHTRLLDPRYSGMSDDEFTKDPVARRELAMTVRSWMLDAAKRLAHGQVREQLLKEAAQFKAADSSKLTFNEMHSRLAVLAERVAEQVRKSDKNLLLDAIEGQIDEYAKEKAKPNVKNVERKISPSVQDSLYYAKKSIRLTEAARDKEIAKLTDELTEIREGAMKALSERGLEVDAEDVKRATEIKMKLAMLAKYGALGRKSYAEIMDSYYSELSRDIAGAVEHHIAVTEERYERTRRINAALVRELTDARLATKAGRDGTVSEEGAAGQFLIQNIPDLFKRLQLHLYTGSEGFEAVEDFRRAMSLAHMKKSLMVMQFESEMRKAFRDIYGEKFEKHISRSDLMTKNPEYDRFSRMGWYVPEDAPVEEYMGREVRRAVPGDGTVPTNAPVHLSKANLIAIWASCQQRDMQVNNYVWGRDKAYLDEIRAIIGEEGVAMANWMTLAYGRIRDELSPVSEEITGMPVLSPDPQYYPLSFAQDARSVDSSRYSVSPFPAFLTQRVNHDMSRLDETRDVFRTFGDKVQEAAHYVGFARIVDMCQDTFFDGKVQTAYAQLYGKKAKDSVYKQLADSLNGGRKASDGLLGQFRNFATATTLFGNLGSSMKQLEGFAAYSIEMGIGNWARSLFRNRLTSSTIRDEFRELEEAGLFKVRGNEDISEAMVALRDTIKRNEPASRWQAAKDWAKRNGMWMTKAVDAFTVKTLAANMYAGRKEFYRENRPELTDEQVRQFALADTDYAIQVTQQTGRQEFLTDMQRGSMAGRLLTQFSGPAFVRWGVELEAWHRAWTLGDKGAKQRFFARILSLHVLCPAVLSTISTATAYVFADDDPDMDEVKEQFQKRMLLSCLTGPLSGWFIIGNVLNAGANEVFMSDVKMERYRTHFETPLLSKLGKIQHDTANLYKEACEAFSAEELTPEFLEALRRELMDFFPVLRTANPVMRTVDAMSE